MTKPHCLLLDLKDDPELIAAYEAHHEAVWPEVLQHLRQADVANMTIWRHGTRLVMLLEAGQNFSFERMAALESENPRVQAWEALMWKFQQALPDAPAGKWQPAQKIFALHET